MMLRSRLGISILLVLLLAAGCHQSGGSGGQGLEGTTITFSIKVDDSERPAIQELLTRFQQQTKATVNLEQLARFREPLGPKVDLLTALDPTTLITRLQKQVSTGTTEIDLFAQDNVALSPLIDGKLVQKLTGLDQGRLQPKKVTSLAFMPDPLAQYFLPFRPNVRLAYANKADFERAGVLPPVTEDDLLASATALAKSGNAKVTLSLAEGDPAAVTVCELIVSHGGNPLVLNDAGSVEAFTFLQKLWKSGLLARDSLLGKYDTEVQNLLTGISALAENWPFTTAQLADAGRIHDFSVYQGWSGPAEAHVIGGDVLGIPRGVKGKQLRASVALADFLRTKESQEFLARRNAWPSFRADVNIGSLPHDEQATFAAIRKAQEHGWYRPSVPYWPEVSARINEAVTRILVMDEPVQTVLDELHGRPYRASP